jgi:hypothetical protein
LFVPVWAGTTIYRRFPRLVAAKPQNNRKNNTMKKYTLIVTLITAASIRVCFCQSPSPTPTPPGVVCKLASRDVELYGFYGTKEIVAERVANVPMKLSERRQFLQITQSGRTDGAKTDVKLFEKQEDGSFKVTEWKNVKAPRLFDSIERAIIENKGMHCVGDACKKVLDKILGPGEPAKPLEAGASPKDAFTPSVDDISGDFGKSMIIFTC